MNLRSAVASLASVLCVVALGQSTPVSMLDARDQIAYSVSDPMRVDELAGRLSLAIGSKRIRVTKVEGIGRPVRQRMGVRSPGRVVLAGSFQAALGEMDWNPDGDASQMTEVAAGIYEVVLSLPVGRYEFKITRNGSWAENWGRNFVAGGENISLEVTEAQKPMKVRVDFNQKQIIIEAAPDAKFQAPTVADRYVNFKLTLSRPVTTTEVRSPMNLRRGSRTIRKVVARGVLDDPYFQPAEDVSFGSTIEGGKTAFRVWSPVSTSASVLLYSQASGGKAKTVRMRRGPGGVWQATVAGDLHGTFYRYRFQSYGVTREATDIYSRAANRDSTRSMVVNLSRTNPTDWASDRGPKLQNPVDAVLYEMSVRDFTSVASDLYPDLRGKYLGAVQKLPHLVDLGITHVHFLPFQNFLVSHAGDYTWGYATNLFNVPEETYASNLATPTQTITEVKQMVKSFHDSGIGIVMDVVYNHTWPPDGKDSAFEQTVPYYYLRRDGAGKMLNESGVGNAFADERKMGRRFVRDSLIYWLKEYNIDGFRFDLLGMHHPESVRYWAEEARKVRPDVLLYGEPWTGGGPTHFPKGSQKGMGVAVFNDNFRNALRGALDGPEPGFALGNAGRIDDTLIGLLGSSNFTASPSETINYFSVHDNLSMWDKIGLSLKDGSSCDEVSAAKIAVASVLFAQGIPILEGGIEIGRTKGGNHNSYDAGDQVNGFHWDRAPQYESFAEFVKGVIRIRTEHPIFRLRTHEEVTQVVSKLPGVPETTVGLRFDGKPVKDRWNEAILLMNPEPKAVTYTLPPGQWNIAIEGGKCVTSSSVFADGTLTATGRSVLLLWR